MLLAIRNFPDSLKNLSMLDVVVVAAAQFLLVVLSLQDKHLSNIFSNKVVTTHQYQQFLPEWPHN